ncbi:uncharacterized protein LOC115717711 [Cannabis sativa]|uniref:uncharacterized protein LOC115717711 n=1 Tax=Cannabis sativa TaxID=3483 RepID=UPI0029CA4470|nr:uncharacterized protein LOC115717711 [Cannabis sativa]
MINEELESNVDTSKDGVVGTDQISVNFWGRIANYFNTHYKDDQRRTGKQCKDHCNKMNQKVTRFNGCYKRVQQAHHIGWFDDQIIKNAHEMYKSENNNLKFQLVDCWRLLKDEPKWNVMYQSEGVKRAKVSRSGAYTSSSNVDISDHKVREERPIGQKATKRKGKGKQDEQLATFYDINQWKANVLEKLVAVQEKKVMAKYMDYLFLGTSNMTPEQKKDHKNLVAHIKTNILNL